MKTTDKIKNHLKEHKFKYIIGGLSVAVVALGAGYVIKSKEAKRLGVVAVGLASEVIDLDLELDALREKYAFMNGGRGL